MIRNPVVLMLVYLGTITIVFGLIHADWNRARKGHKLVYGRFALPIYIVASMWLLAHLWIGAQWVVFGLTQQRTGTVQELSTDAASSSVGDTPPNTPPKTP